jgi:hypothetical protein
MEENPFEKVIVAQLASRFSSYGTGILVMAFTTTGHWTLSSASPINFIPSKSLFLSNTLNKDYCIYVLVSQVLCSLQALITNFCVTFTTTMHDITHTQLCLLDFKILTRIAQIVKLLLTYFSIPFFLPVFRSKYSQQRLVPK